MISCAGTVHIALIEPPQTLPLCCQTRVPLLLQCSPCDAHRVHVHMHNVLAACIAMHPAAAPISAVAALQGYRASLCPNKGTCPESIGAKQGNLSEPIFVRLRPHCGPQCDPNLTSPPTDLPSFAVGATSTRTHGVQSHLRACRRNSRMQC
jgi:hypothetical protein